ncbi:MAG: hypothetical protein ACRCUT_00285, partial [Spirochaetota bacterium]
WPLPYYTGGTGEIWWWNNYDIFLIVFAALAASELIYFAGMLFRVNTKAAASAVLILCAGLVFFQIKTRNFDFNYSGFTPKYAEYGKESKDIQKKLLPGSIYGIAAALDRKLRINF